MTTANQTSVVLTTLFDWCSSADLDEFYNVWGDANQSREDRNQYDLAVSFWQTYQANYNPLVLWSKLSTINRTLLINRLQEL